jgi:glycosyltransferase involved in cell wall biosynthesis
MANRTKSSVTIAIAQSTLPDGAPISGHSRVWTSVRSALDELSVLDHTGAPGVWFYSAHGGPPEVEGRSVAVAYEAGWTVPGAYVGYPSSYLDSIDDATHRGVLHADAVVVGAESAKRELISAYGLLPDSIHVVPFGVDLDGFNPNRKGDLASLPELGQLVGTPFIAFVNSLAPRKNVGIVREAVQQLLSDDFPHRLVMVASAAKHLGGDVEEIEREAFAQFPGREGRVIRLQGVSDHALSVMLANASVLCAPSSHEGFGLTVLEAMASGTPVVAGRRGALPEVVGTGGILVEPTVEDVTSGLRRILDSDLEQWRSSARAQALNFPWSRTAEGWAKVAKSVVISGSPKRRWLRRGS